MAAPDFAALNAGYALLRVDCVAKLFCPSKRVRLIQDQASMRNVDSRIHSLRSDCCVFLFYSLSAMTFATQSALLRRLPMSVIRPLSGVNRKRYAQAEFFSV